MLEPTVAELAEQARPAHGEPASPPSACGASAGSLRAPPPTSAVAERLRELSARSWQVERVGCRSSAPAGGTCAHDAARVPSPAPARAEGAQPLRAPPRAPVGVRTVRLRRPPFRRSTTPPPPRARLFHAPGADARVPRPARPRTGRPGTGRRSRTRRRPRAAEVRGQVTRVTPRRRRSVRTFVFMYWRPVRGAPAHVHVLSVVAGFRSFASVLGGRAVGLLL
ncbi:hypothetical protein QJS66_04735 [Kocuria rhizophila]|nr:hypothetical protein QJS66_04735 [Kocuria rhizophila]